MASKYFQKALAKVKPENKRFVQKNLDIVEQVLLYLAEKGLTQKDLAVKLEKSEAEISRMLSGTHNLTLKTIAKLEAALNEDVVVTPKKEREKLKPVPVSELSFDSKGLVKKKGGSYSIRESDSANMQAYEKGLGMGKIRPLRSGQITSFDRKQVS